MNELQDERGNAAERDVIRGQHLERLGRHEEALGAYRDALAQDPHNGHVLRLLAYCQLRSKREEPHALDTIERAIAVDPDEALGHVIRALILAEKGQPGRAREAAEKAIELDPEEPVAHAALAQADMRAGSWAGAEAAAKKALSLDPDEPMAATLLAHALFCQGKQVENQGHVARMLQAEPENPYAHHAAGLAALQAGDYRLAEHHFLEALRLDSEFEPARQGLLDVFRARSFLYRAYLRYGFLMTRLSRGRRLGLRVGLRLGLVGGLVLLAQLSGHVLSEDVLVATLALAGLYLFFVVWTYGAGGLGSLFVMGDRRARQALLPRQRVEAVVVGGSVVGGLGIIGIGGAMTWWSLALCGVGLLGMAVPWSVFLKTRRQAGRRFYGSLAVMSTLGVLCLGLNLHWPDVGLRSWGLGLFAGVLLVTTWSAAFDIWRD